MVDDLPPDRRLAIDLAPRAMRAPFAALLAFDARCARIVRAARDPLIGQMRLTWWHDALRALDRAPAPGEPLLQEVELTLLPHGIAGADIALLIDGWKALLADPLDDAALEVHARERGGGLFTLAGRLFDTDPPLLAAAGRAWALADVARTIANDAVAGRADALAHHAYAIAFARAWPSAARPIGTLALLARSGGAPLRDFARLTRFRLTGR